MGLSLADHLRALPDDELAALVRLRPDLVVPVPSDISALAVRAQSRLSVARALDGLDRFTLQVLDALRLSRSDDGTTSVGAVLALAAPSGVPAERIRAAIGSLRSRCIGYGPDRLLRLVDTVDEVCSPYPAGLGRPAAELGGDAAALAADPAGLRRAVLAASPPARAVLDRLAAGSPLGTVAATSLAPGSGSPVRALVEAHLLVPVSEDTVEMPREVGLLLRRETGPLGHLHPDPPPLAAAGRDPAAVDSAGAGQAMEAVRYTEALLEALAAEPAGMLRAGGLGVRDLRRLARTAGTDEPTAALLLETAWAAGLLGELQSEKGDGQYLPAAGYDAWRSSGIAARWLRLVAAWLAMSRAPSLVGRRDDRDRPINALSTEVERSGTPARRLAALSALADAPAGSAVEPDDVIAMLAWRTPRRSGRSVTAGVTTGLAEAATLGVTGLGALTGYGRLLLAEPVDPDEIDEDPLGLRPDAAPRPVGAVRALDALLPAPVEHVLLQADLTLVVPGPPDPTLAAELALVAAAESPSVFRVTQESLRRALDTGYAAADLHLLFARRSRTPVPQALTYLVDDVARRHGGLRAGPAGGYLRSEDEALLAEVVADRRLAGLSLRRLAPTVLATPYTVSRLLATLRSAGYAPVAEDATGTTVLSRPRGRRAPARAPLPQRRVEDPLAMPRLSQPRLAGIVEQIRRGEAAARSARRAPVALKPSAGTGTAAGQAHIQALAVLQQALRDSARVWVGYVDAHGTSASRLVRPVSMGGGYLRAEDDRTEMLHTFALHRITAATLDE